MRTFTTKFVTTSNNYDLLQDANVLAMLKSYKVDLTYKKLFAKITIIIDSITQIKFEEEGVYEDFVCDVVYDGGKFFTYDKIIIKDSGINGSITIEIG